MYIPFININIKTDDEQCKELIKRRIKTFLKIGGKITLSEWSMMSNELHNLIEDVVEELSNEYN